MSGIPSQRWGAPLLMLLFFAAGGMEFRPAGLSPVLLMTLLAVAGVGWLVWQYAAGGADAAEQRRLRRFFAAAGVLVLLLGIYLLNPAYRWTDAGGAVPRGHIPFLPAAAYPDGATGSALFFIGALSVFGLARSAGEKEFRPVFWLIATAGAGAALAAIGQRVTPRPYEVFPLTAFFVYENHFAAFANLLLPVVLLLALRIRSEAFVAGRISSPAGLWIAAALLLFGAICLSRSRMGILAATAGILGAALQAYRLQRKYPLMLPPGRFRFSGMASALLLPAVCLPAGWFLCRWNPAQLGTELRFRAGVLADVVRAGLDQPVWGTGPGSFAAVFPYYQSLPADRYFFSHAHCEPLEFWMEYGFLGAGVILTVFLLLMPAGVRPERKGGVPSFAEVEGAGALLALGAAGLHSLTDFPFRHPLNALLAAAWCGMVFRYIPELFKRRVADGAAG